MKKFLTFLLTLLVSIFVFNNNVKAENIKHIEYTEPISNISFNYDLDIDKYPYYYLTMRTKTDSNKKYLSFSLSYAGKNFYYNGLQVSNCGNGLSTYCYGWLKNSNTSYNTYTIDYNISDINEHTITTSTGNKLIALYSYNDWESYVNNFNNWSSYNSPYIDGPMPILISHDLLDNSNNLIISKDYINNNSGYNPIPEIIVTKIRENELILNNGGSVVLNNEIKISFSNFDTSKYKYLYSLDKEENVFSLNPKNIAENDYEFLINKNCFLHIKVLDLEDNYITSGTYKIDGIIENIIDYSIEDGTEKGKKLTIYYYNFETTDYHIVSNFQTGSEKKYDSELMGTIIYDNLNLDNTYSINSYDKDNNLLKRKTIDIQVEDAKLNNKRYITHTIFKERKSIFFSYFNIKKNDKCFYKISSEEEIEVSCDKSYEINLNKNGYIDLYIKNNEEIVLKRGVNVNFINNLPQFKFDSYYKDSESKQVLKIIVENLQSNDKIYYSYDKELWNELETKRINYLDFYVSKEVYFKVVRDETIVSEAYFDLVYKAYENSSDNNNLEKYDGLKGLLEYFKDITRNVTNAPFEIGKSAYELIRQSKFGLYILLIIVSSIIILILKSIKR